MKKCLSLVALVGSVALALTACSNGSEVAGTPSANSVQETAQMTADYPSYGSPLAAAENSDLVVVGIPLSSWDDVIYPDRIDSDDPIENPQAGLSEEEIDEFIADSGVPVTVTEFEVTEVLSGDAQVGDKILVDQLGGTSGGIMYEELNTTNMRSFSASAMRSDNTRIMLSLASEREGHYGLVNPEEGFNMVSSNGEIDTANGKDIGETVTSFKKSLRERMN